MKLILGAITSLFLLSVFAAQAAAYHDRDQENTPRVNVPPNGAEYLMEVVGRAHIAGTDDYRPVSLKLDWIVVSTKTSGVPQFNFELMFGEVGMDDDIYSLDNGVMTIRVQQARLASAGAGGVPTLDMYAALAAPIPLTMDEPVLVVEGQDRKSASMQIGADEWILDFEGTMTRIA
jgi:hypothetical protein